MQERKELGKIQKVSFGIGGYQDSRNNVEVMACSYRSAVILKFT